ncbi:MAG TPA: hypothetical protein VMU56_07695 [Beijerinckiaceae bacterium]|nr:hypothetical protein [Beijerinckiaceae bacterium]
MVLILQENEVSALIDRANAAQAIESVYREAALGGAAVSRPSAMRLRGASGGGATFKVKGAVLDARGVAGFRLIGDLDHPPGASVSYIYLVDASTAEPLALIAEAGLSRVRTALTGLVTCRALARADARRMALVGTGRIAEEFVRCLPLVSPERSVLVASRSQERALAAAQRWRDLTDATIEAAPSIKAALAQADIVVTLSDANERLFGADDLREATLVCAMGGRHEFDSDVLDWAQRLIVDEFDFVCDTGNGAHWLASGQITRERLAAKVEATIGQVLTHENPKAGAGRTLAIIQGMAICDVALAVSVYDRARANK